MSKLQNTLSCGNCFSTRYVTTLSENSRLKIDLCSDCLPKGYSKEIIEISKAKCLGINTKEIDPENEKDFNILLKELKSDSSLINIVNSIELFKKNYHDIKKAIKHKEILENPEKHSIVRIVDAHQFTALHLFTRNQVFQIISKSNRAKKTRVDEYGKVIDISEDRTFLGWGGNIHFTISGPVLCDYDQQVFDACVKIWHTKSKTGIIVETNLSEIWKNLGNVSKIGKDNRESLRRSLSRLHKVSIEVRSMDKKNKSFWGGGIFDTIRYIDTNENKIFIKFNLYMASNYLEGSYATLNHNLYNNLTSYAKKIYMFIMSHRDSDRFISIDKLRPLIGVSDEVSSKRFKDQISSALSELKEKEVLDPISKIENNILYTTVLSKAWDACAIHNQMNSSSCL